MSEKSKIIDKRIHYRPAQRGIVCGERRHEPEAGLWRKTLTDIRRVTCYDCFVVMREILSRKLRDYDVPLHPLGARFAHKDYKEDN